MANASPPLPGTILGDRYAVIATVVESAGYVELRAHDREVDVEVGLWWLRPELFADPQRRDAVLGAGVELRALKDTALRTCYGVVRGAGGVWATWQAASSAGVTPATDGRPRSLADVRRWIDAVARGLGVLHRNGLVHGRLVPADIVSIGGVLRVAGGGIWRDVDPQAALRAWQAGGAEHYLAPELRRFQAPTPASDVWSLATIALELIAGVPGSQPDLARAAARRHPGLGAVLVGAMNPDPGRRPELPALLEAARNAAEAPYADAVPRGKPAGKPEGASTLVGHASGEATRVERPGRSTASRPAASRDRPTTAPPPIPTTSPTAAVSPMTPRGYKPPSRPPPMAAAKPMRAHPITQPGVAPKPGAFAPDPASFALPTPATAPPAPRQSAPRAVIDTELAAPRTSRPVVAVQPPGAAPPPAQPPAQPMAPAAMPTPARVAMAGAIERARTAPPGEFVVAAVSLKGSMEKSGPIPLPARAQPPVPTEPTGETPHVPKAKLRAIADVQGGRTFSVAPGQMGYLAPPKAVSDARRGAERKRWWLVVALIAAGAAVVGVVLALLL